MTHDKSPGAARNSVTDRLKTAAKDSPWTLADLQRQYAYDRLVERLYRLDPDWIKGATALLARRVSVRHTLDIDLYHSGAIVEVEQMARDAAALDIGDWVRFDLSQSVLVEAGGAQARRIPVNCYIGTKVWATFRVDIVADGITIVGTPDSVAPLTEIEPVDSARTNWRAYPIEDHVADKVLGIIEPHKSGPSTRYKDLIDLVAIRTRCLVKATDGRQALLAESTRRGVPLPTHFDAPEHLLWLGGYAAEARPEQLIAHSPPICVKPGLLRSRAVRRRSPTYASPNQPATKAG